MSCHQHFKHYLRVLYPDLNRRHARGKCTITAFLFIKFISMRLVTCSYLALDVEPTDICSSPCEVIAPDGVFSMMAVPQRQTNAVLVFCSAAGAKLPLAQTGSTATTETRVQKWCLVTPNILIKFNGVRFEALSGHWNDGFCLGSGILISIRDSAKGKPNFDSIETRAPEMSLLVNPENRHPRLYGLVSLLIMYTSPMRMTEPIIMDMAMMGKLTRANSSCRTLMCFLARISRHSMPANDALNAVLNAP